MQKCPRCGSSRIKRSHSRSIAERFLRLLNRRAYRCVNCGWRGIRQGASSRTSDTKYNIKQLIAIILLLLLALAAIFYWLTREEAKPVLTAKKRGQATFLDIGQKPKGTLG
jgi:predicted RNA-binding Zn-ribbon protein involved in translation (DUF1610 family)